MNNRIKIVSIIAGVLIIAFTGFIGADYFGIFGTTVKTKLAFAEVRIRTIEKDTGALIVNTHVRCFQKRNDNACTLRDSHQAGVASVHIPYKRIVESSLLFTQTETIEKAADPNIHIMLIHKDHINTTKTLSLDEVFNKKNSEYTVEMPARDWGNSEVQDS